MKNLFLIGDSIRFGAPPSSPGYVTINDLYSITCKFDDTMRSDWVHYNEEGSKILADAVIDKCFK